MHNVEGATWPHGIARACANLQLASLGATAAKKKAKCAEGCKKWGRLGGVGVAGFAGVANP